jgi:uncharacterized protein (UPF0210 family)
MKIRSITCFYTPNQPDAAEQLTRLASFSRQLQTAAEAAGIEVQSRRLATPSFTSYTHGKSQNEIILTVQGLKAQAKAHGFTYLSVGPALPNDPASFELIPALIAATKDVFVTGIISDSEQFYPAAIQAAAKVITRAASITPDGFANLRFSALANVPAGAPFFPAAYHAANSSPAFSLAIECADAVVSTFKGQTSLSAARAQMLSAMNGFAAQIESLISSIQPDGIQFLGFDFSPAPYPEDSCSLGGGVEAVMSASIGPVGSLAAAAVIADTLDQGAWLHAGFNGLMLPVLEDSILALRAAEGVLSVKDLLLYSTVCGTGLDTVPLAGNVNEPELAALLFDIAALSVRLGKSLTARLMPIPGKQAGEVTEFNFSYFANSRAMPLQGQPVATPLNGSEPVPLAPKHTYTHKSGRE